MPSVPQHQHRWRRFCCCGPSHGGGSRPAWYVVRSKPRAEATAAANRRSGAIEVFLARLARYFARHGARDIVLLLVSLSPGCLFTRPSLDTRFRIASWTPRVAHLLPGPDGARAAIDESVVAALAERARDGDVLRVHPARLHR